MSSPAEIVSAFIGAIEASDLDAALAMVTENVVYDNVPMASVVGPDAVREVLHPFLSQASEIDWVVHRQVAEGTTVMNERVDRFLIGDRWMELPVMGVFEVTEDGRISLWRDYFDLGTFEREMAGG